jgi:hypothetical protein
MSNNARQTDIGRRSNLPPGDDRLAIFVDLSAEISNNSAKDVWSFGQPTC